MELLYEGNVMRWYYSDVTKWKTDGCADLSETYLRGLFGIVDNKWVIKEEENNA